LWDVGKGGHRKKIVKKLLTKVLSLLKLLQIPFLENTGTSLPTTNTYKRQRERKGVDETHLRV